MLLLRSPSVEKALGPDQTFKPGDPTKGLRMARDSDSEGQWDLITELPQDWGKQTLGEYEQNFVSTKTQGTGGVTPQESELGDYLPVLEGLM